MRSYLDPELAPLQRVEEAYAALFMLEGWFTHLKDKDALQKAAERLAKQEEMNRTCSERNITKTQYNKEQREERQKQKQEAKVAKEQEKRKKQEEKAKKRETKVKQKRDAKKAKCQNALSSAPTAAPAESFTGVYLLLLPPANANEAPSSNDHALPSLAATAAPVVTLAAPVRHTVASQFTTRTAAAGVAFNAHFLVGLVYTLATNVDLRHNVPFAPRQLTEQEAEKIFRAARAVLGGENFTLADFLRRCNHLMAHGILKAQHSGVDFVYPACEKAWRWDETLASDRTTAPLPDAVTVALLLEALRRAQMRAECELRKVGVDVQSFTDIRHVTASHHVDEMDCEPDDDEQAAAKQADAADAQQNAGDLQADLESLAEEVLLLNGFIFTHALTGRRISSSSAKHARHGHRGAHFRHFAFAISSTYTQFTAPVTFSFTPTLFCFSAEPC